MCIRLRKIFRRGRSGVPVTEARTRSCRRVREALRLYLAIASNSSVSHQPGAPAYQAPRGAATVLARLAGLTSLAANAFARIAQAFALVGLRRAPTANIRSDLPDQLLI